MENVKCNKKPCFANGCGGFCKLYEMNKYASHLVQEFKDSPYTCSRPKELLASDKSKTASLDSNN